MIGIQSFEPSSKMNRLLNKVPEVTVFFWIIKVLATTVGETASDFLNVNLNFGLVGTSIVMGILLAIVLFFQVKAKRYIAVLYWSTIVLISIFGTLVTDNLTDGMNVPLEFSTILFSILLAATFAVWYANEKTLSIHSIFTRKREAFYWLAILFTFALGTASGDLMAEALGLGYAVTGVIIAVIITMIAVSWKLGLDSVLSFWLIYILTRPLGASVGDLLTQPHKYGGLGLGATNTTIIFTAAILGLVAYLSISKKDVIAKEAVPDSPKEELNAHKNNAMWQVAAVMTILIVAGGSGYYWRHGVLAAQENNSLAEASPSESQEAPTDTTSSPSESNTSAPNQSQKVSVLGDLSDFQTITQDTLNLVNNGNLPGATARVADLEHDWDASEAKLKPKNTAKWTEIDNSIDKVLRDLRAVHPDASSCKSSLEALSAVLS